jgi:hypothetical protein
LEDLHKDKKETRVETLEVEVWSEIFQIGTEDEAERQVELAVVLDGYKEKA